MTYYSRDRVIAAPADDIWAYVRQFGGLHTWLPTSPVAAELAGDPETIGTVRQFKTDGEVSFAEQLVTLDDNQKVFSYSIVTSPFPVRHHLATIRLIPLGEATFVHWEGTLDTGDEALSQQMANMIVSSTFEPGLQGLAEKTEKQ